MRIDINPFHTRASDNIDSEEKFIKLFSPEILDVFKDYGIWTTVNVFRSSPGGGKTTLLKIFTPKILRIIKKDSTHDEHSKGLYEALKNLDVYDKKGSPKIASALLQFDNQYATLEYLGLNESQKLRIFFSLLNTRIILSVLKAICEIKDFNYPGDLTRISLNEEGSLEIPTYLRQVTNGYTLYEWATAQEENICEELDSIYSIDNDNLVGSDNLYSLDFLAPHKIKIDGNKFEERILVMLDDVSNLSPSQRGYLVNTIINKRPFVNTWIAERLKALTMEELLSEGSIQGRDLNMIELESFWAPKHIQFEKFAKSVANRRVKVAFDNKNFTDFASFLSTEMSNKFQSTIDDALNNVIARVKTTYGSKSKNQAWISVKENLEVNNYEKLLEWRTLEILLFRENNKKQATLFEELSEEMLDYQEGNDVKTAAQLFLNQEFKIPFYYGISVVCRLSSSNIEQFLNIAGELFDQILANTVKQIVNSNHRLELQPEKQEEIIKKLVNKRWKDLSSRIPLFDDVKRLLDAIGEYCQSETYVPNAWNSPGINGIAITMAQRNEIKDKILKDKNNEYYKLAKCLTICISYNLIDFKLNYRCKGKEWMILYLNRIYCAKYQLPLNNGKFKEKTLKDILGWLNNGIQPQKKLKF